jgi:glycosyltransferase involved in cell wall biosynthesis
MVLGILSRSDTVASPTEALAEALANETGRPVVTLAVPSFGMVETIPQRPGGDRQVVIGFAGSTDHLTTVQDLVIPALEMVAQRGIEFRFEIVGPEPAVPPVLQGRMRHIPFFACYADWIAFRNSAPWDIALAPLPAGKFQACKYHNKFVEMGAAGLPCIFSNVPTYAGVVRHMHNGVLAENTPQAWADAITLLARTPAVRRRLAACAWEQVRRENAPEAVCRSYCATLQGAFRHRAPALTGLAGLMVTLRVRGLVLWLRLALAEGPGKVARRLRRAIGAVRRRLAPR